MSGDSAPGPGYVFRPYRGDDDHGPMAAVRRGCARRDGVDARSVVEGLPTAAEIAEDCARLDDPSGNQLLVEHGGGVVGYATIRWWEERDGTATALLLDAGYRRVFSLVELELDDLGQLPADRLPLPLGVRVGAVGPSGYYTAWRTVVDSYAGAAFTETWTFARFLATADPACWRAAWDGRDMAGVALCSLRRHDPTVGEVEELSVRAESRRLGLGRALLLDGLRCLRAHGAETARLYTGTANPHRSYDLYESVGFRRRNEYVRYRKPVTGPAQAPPHRPE
ncbi:GNAT family N-acetyltransferase, partial [Streptomyces sp. NEAU-H3]|uniref:GNAT family N-acetyltransferase n=1 Tax=Streptomyces sp. NEAU-H3 TaxID=2720636 RepID=UPI00143BF610